MKLVAEKVIGKLGVIHFIGIGGIGMSGLAEILHNLGYQVQGSDLSGNYNVSRLEEKGIKVFIGHHASNVEEAAIVVKSTAVKDDNAEIIAAHSKRLPIIKRAEMLAEIMRLKISVAISGTHGKTTTTSLVASMFEKAGLNPTVINGGIINTHGTNAYLGKGEFLIAEADESDATFIKVPATIGIITNIDSEHLDFYGTFDNLRSAFKTFVENLPFYGFAVLCKDHSEVAALAEEVIDRNIITYGIEANDVDVRAVNIRHDIDGSIYDVILSAKFTGQEQVIQQVSLPIAGLHNVLNSLAAIAIAAQLRFDQQSITDGFKSFKGVKRRFTKTGAVNGVTIIDDYAHHPKEILATLKTARHMANKNNGRVIAVFQPHRYSRVQSLFSEFSHCFTYADAVIVCDIYSAGEEPVAGLNKEVIAAAIKASDYTGEVMLLESPDNLANLVMKHAKPQDVVLCMGAGNITSWAYKLPSELENLSKFTELAS